MKMKNCIPEFMVDNMEESVKFYTDLLGFEVKISAPEESPIFVSLANGGVELMLYARNEFANEIPKLIDMEIGGSFALFIEVEDIERMYESLKEKVKIIQELHTSDYGTTEFSMEDNNGYVLMFNQKK